MFFKIPKKAIVTDKFQCPQYPELRPIAYTLCLSRQLKKTPLGGDFLYPLCNSCETGKIIKDHFKDYQPSLRKKKAKKGEDPYSRHFVGSSKGKTTDFDSVDEGSIPSPIAQVEKALKVQIYLLVDLIERGRVEATLERIILLAEIIKNTWHKVIKHRP